MTLTLIKRKRFEIGIIAAWYDGWVGYYWDKKNTTLYLLPLPMLGVVIRFIPVNNIIRGNNSKVNE